MLKRPLGMTLIEILTAMTLLGLLMTAAIGFFVPTLGHFAAVDSTYDAERSAANLIRSLTADLRESRAGWVCMQPLANPSYPNQIYIAIPTSRDPIAHQFLVQADGSPNWQCYVVYWPVTDPVVPAVCTIKRCLEGGTIPTVGAFDFTNLTNSTPGRMMAGGVSMLSVTTGASPSGHGQASIKVVTVRFIKDMTNTSQGENTVDMLY